MTIEVLETRSEGSVDIVILASETVLSSIAQGVELISPMTIEVEPFGWSGRIGRRGTQGIINMIICISMRIQQGVPERTAIGLIVQQAPWQDVRVDARRSVHRMCSHGRVDHRLVDVSDVGTLEGQMSAYSSSDLFDRLVAVGFTRRMSTEKERFGLAIVKAHETVLPIPDVVAEADVKNDIS